MKLLEFRVTNFRSIVDTGWCPFSPDGVTVLVGQNESGKSSLLHALAATFSTESITDDDLRIGASFPEVRLRLLLDACEYPNVLNEIPEPYGELIQHYFETSKNNIVEIKFSWAIELSDKKRNFLCVLDIDEPGTLAIFAELNMQWKRDEFLKSVSEASSAVTDEDRSEDDDDEEEQTEDEEATSEKEDVVKFKPSDIAHAIYSLGPRTTLFDQRSGLLPDRVDIVSTKNGTWQLNGEGSKAAGNFLTIADIDLDKLVKGDTRERQHMLSKANAKLTTDFAKFWSQTIGKSEKLELECNIENYGAESGDKIGKPHLTFWVNNGFSRLYPKQRSEGVRWFVSFYLQLKASEKERAARIFLLDEPGANLHMKAQKDVLKLINQLRETTPVIYSTHSPDLIEYEKLYRVLAVQRDGEHDDAPTSVIPAHRLGAASRETLAAVLNAMGADLTHQQVIQKSNNILLEEISGFYYFSSFWKLTKATQPANFIAATGASNIEPLANMFLGWGLDFIVSLDDDPHGRDVYKKLKLHLFGDDAELAAANMFKISDCRGIEDVFSKSDFANYVLQDGGRKYKESNSEYLKSLSLSKPVLAFRFYIKVRDGGLLLDNFDATTKAKIEQIVDAISSRLKAKAPKKGELA